MNCQFKVRNKFITVNDEDPLLGYYLLVGAQLQVPFNFGKFGIMPFGNINFGPHLAHIDSDTYTDTASNVKLYLSASSEVGVRFFLPQDNNHFLFMFFKYSSKFINEMFKYTTLTKDYLPLPMIFQMKILT